MKNNKQDLFSDFRDWANSQGIDCTDSSHLMESMVKWAQTDGRERFNYKTISIKDPQRFEDAERCIQLLKSLVLNDSPDADINISADNSDIAMHVITDSLNFYPEDMNSLLQALSLAGNIEITSQADGQISFCVTYRDIFIPVKLRHNSKKGTS